MKTLRRRISFVLRFAAVVALAFAFTRGPIGWAQADHSTVVRILRDARDFRARVRAALALGSSNDQSVTPHLVHALEDTNPAVRAAAATAIGRLGDSSAVTALQRVLRDDRSRVVRTEAERAIRRIRVRAGNSGPSQPNRRRALRSSGSNPYPSITMLPRARDIVWSRVRYVVKVGSMENRSNFSDSSLESVLTGEVMRNLHVLRGVAVLPAENVPRSAAREIRRRRLPQLRLEGSVNRIDRRRRRREVSVRAEVSIMLLAEPGRAIRSVLNGAATGSQPARGRGAAAQQQERQLAQQALTGAVRSAMSGAARAIASGANH